MRWNHPRHGLLGPEEFVPIAEQTGLIMPLTRWVLGAAVRQVQAWQGQGYELSVAVNLSARSSSTPRSRSTSRAARAPPDRADAARARDHREHDHARPRPRDDHARAPVGDRPAALDRRLRHRLLVARLPQAAAGRRDQDRQVVRARDGDGALRRRDRPLDHRSRPQPRPQVVAEGVEDRRSGRSSRASAATSPRATTSRARCRPTSSRPSWAWRRPTRAAPSARRCASSPAPSARARRRSRAASPG